MYYELKETEFKKILPITEGLRYQLVIESIIAGNTHGRIFVDNLDSPKTALIWDLMGEILFTGASNNEPFNESIKRLLIKELMQDAIKRHIRGFSLYYYPETWNTIIERLFKEQSIKKTEHRFYEFNKRTFDWEKHIPDTYNMKYIDDDFLLRNELKNYEAVTGWIASFWKSTNAFTKNGVGYCLLHGDTIVSWCISVFVSDNKYEFGLETDVNYRNKGFAKLTSSACIDYCISHNTRPFWNCSSDNIPSHIVAESIGFIRAKDYFIYQLEFIK